MLCVNVSINIVTYWWRIQACVGRVVVQDIIKGKRTIMKCIKGTLLKNTVGLKLRTDDATIVARDESSGLRVLLHYKSLKPGGSSLATIVASCVRSFM